MTVWLLAGLLVPVFFPIAGLAASGTLELVRQRGTLKCGVSTNFPGFSTTNSLEEFSGFDTDLCRAIAATVLGDHKAVSFVTVSWKDRIDRLEAKEFEVLIQNSGITLGSNARFGQFTAVGLLDGQGFMVRKQTGIRSSQELDNVSVCVGRETLTESTLRRFFKLNDLRYNAKLYGNNNDAFKAYAAGECSAVTGSRARLAARRTLFAQPEAHVLLPDIISVKPLGPVVRNDDVEWAKIVSWSLHCLINAEETGVSSQNLTQLSQEDDFKIQLLLGKANPVGPLLGLDAFWCANTIEQVGNYAEIYERNLGPDTPLALDRGVNRLWSRGGLLYAMPFR